MDLAPRHRILAGRVALWGGALALSLGAGVALGYWLSDAGARWFTVATAVLVLWAAALLSMGLGSWQLGPGIGLGRGRKRVLLLATLALLAVAARFGVAALDRPNRLSTLDGPAFAATFQLDGRQYRDLRRGLDGVIADLDSATAPLAAAGRTALPGAETEERLVDLWARFVDTAMALDQVRRTWEGYTAFDLSRLERPRHVQAFLLTFAAEMSLFEAGERVFALLDRNANVVKLLNLPRPDRGLAADSVAFVREELSGLTDASRVVAGANYLRYLDGMLGAGAEVEAAGSGWLRREAEGLIARLGPDHPVLLAARATTHDVAPLLRAARHLTFPAQAGIAETMGDTRLARAGRYLVDAPLREQLRARLQPGDVLLARKNWYLSNVGLPGFWPHAILYVGSAEELAARFDADPTVRAWVTSMAGRDLTFTEYLARTWPSAWAQRRLDLRGPAEPLLVIEAISEGVVQNSLDHVTGDYVAALRPRLPEVAKARAIAQAFGFLGRPYDFDFDFATDDALVCTELVWRSYRPSNGVPGLRIEPPIVAGRRTLPAHAFAQLFDRERAAGTPQLDFVAFVEGNERTGSANFADEAAFRATVTRSKWDLGQP